MIKCFFYSVVKMTGKRYSLPNIKRRRKEVRRLFKINLRYKNERATYIKEKKLFDFFIFGISATRAIARASSALFYYSFYDVINDGKQNQCDRRDGNYDFQGAHNLSPPFFLCGKRNRFLYFKTISAVITAIIATQIIRASHQL